MEPTSGPLRTSEGAGRDPGAALPRTVVRDVHPFRMRYRYRNRTPEPLDLWLSLPRDRTEQAGLRTRFLRGEPREARIMDVEESGRRVSPEEAASGSPLGPLEVNALVRFRLRPGERITLEVRGRTRRARLAGAGEGGEELPGPTWLDPAARRYYLRSTRLVHADRETVREARRIVGSAGTPDSPDSGARALENLRRLFATLTGPRYRYRWPPRDRGSGSLRRTGAGDCGDFAFLLAAWVRSLGIPARVVFGSWARGRMQAHVWNEVFIRGSGWIPVDAGTASLLRRDPERFRGFIHFPPEFPADRDPDLYLGGLEGERVAFSLEAEPHPLPGIERDGPPPRAPALSLAGRPFRWGGQLLEGRVPYLQPAYPSTSEAARLDTDEGRIGRWSFRGRVRNRGLRVAEYAGLALGVTGLVAALLVDLGSREGAVRAAAAAGFAVFSLSASVRSRSPFLAAVGALLLGLVASMVLGG